MEVNFAYSVDPCLFTDNVRKVIDKMEAEREKMKICRVKAVAGMILSVMLFVVALWLISGAANKDNRMIMVAGSILGACIFVCMCCCIIRTVDVFNRQKFRYRKSIIGKFSRAVDMEDVESICADKEFQWLFNTYSYNNLYAFSQVCNGLAKIADADIVRIEVNERDHFVNVVFRNNNVFGERFLNQSFHNVRIMREEFRKVSVFVFENDMLVFFPSCDVKMSGCVD